MSTTTTTTTHKSTALPDFYYFVFGVYEPFLSVTGLIGTLYDPITTHNLQAPWPNNIPPTSLSIATTVTIIQLAHVCALLGFVNILVLFIARKHFTSHPALQEKLLWSLLTPLLVGDVAHIGLTLWALGDDRWDFVAWSPITWAVVVLGLSILFPRIAWHMGIGRYVDARDGPFKKSTPIPVVEKS